MSISKDHRWISVAGLSVRKNANSPDSAPDLNVIFLLENLKNNCGTDDGKRTFQNNDRRMWCSDISWDEQYAWMLIHIGDATVPDPAFVNLNTLDTRDAGKGDDEGAHYCAHILIERNVDARGCNLTLIEKVPGISLTSCKSYFNWTLAKPAAKLAFSENGDKKIYRAVVELDGFQSLTLKQAMATGTVMDVTLVGNQQRDAGSDEVPLIREREEQMRWVIGSQLNWENAKAILKKGFDVLRGWETMNAKEFLVRIKSPDGQEKTISVSSEAEILRQPLRKLLKGQWYSIRRSTTSLSL